MLFNNSVTSVIILLFCQNGVTFSDSVKISSVKKYDESNVFVPTNEWQEIKRDQVIPKGLHVQIDLTTGMRRAKLLDSTDDDNQASQLVLSKNNDIENPNENLNKPLKEKYTLNLDKIGAIDPETLSEIKNKYRSYTEIKEDFKNLELAVKTEMEVLNDLLEKFKDIKNNKPKSSYNEINWDDTWLNTLVDMEYLVHQVDNARMFTQANGIENIVFPSLNSSSAEVRAQACRLLGAASQNNVPSKIAALESGAIRVLLHTFLSDQSPTVQSSALYGLSSIIRNFPLAQKLLINNGGIEVLNSVFHGENSDHLKLQVSFYKFGNVLKTLC
uniref:Nucleotide exchange factor SIL1 n=1 Tax=Clastoptera arizonana TaxID=38151 RepID=A0A1B6E0B4_9HEMI